MTIREVRQGLLTQGVNEQIAYTLTTTPWGSSPTSACVAVYDVVPGDTHLDVSASCLLGVPTVNGDIITLPVLRSLTRGHIYQLQIKFVVSNNILEAFAMIQAEN